MISGESTVRICWDNAPRVLENQDGLQNPAFDFTPAKMWTQNGRSFSPVELDGVPIVLRIDDPDWPSGTTAFFLHLPDRIFAEITLMSTITLKRRWNDSARQNLSPSGYDGEWSLGPSRSISGKTDIQSR